MTPHHSSPPSPRRCLLLFFLGLPTMVACRDKDTSSPGGSPGGADSVADSGLPADTFCADQGLTVRPFTAGGTGTDFGQTVPDFTWSTTAGDWTLSAEWTGCDSYILLNYSTDTNYPELDDARLWGEWLESSPRNVHYFIIPFSSDVDSVLTPTQATFAEALDLLDAELADHWAARVHFVLDNAYEVDWAGPLNSQYSSSLGGYRQNALAIDRFQVAREVGSFCDPADGWRTCPPAFSGQEAVYFNFESDRADRLDAMGDTTVIPVFTREPGQDPGWAGQRILAEVALPDASTMASFDTLELDLTLECKGYPAASECPAWDYLVYAYLCEVDDPKTPEDESLTCTTELGRWITTYWRPGRWVHDVTPFLALLQTGGTRKIAFYTQQYYDVSLSLRLSNQGRGVRPVAMQPLFGGGSFWDQYNWGVTHTVSKTAWTVGSHASDTETYTVTQVDAAGRVIVAQDGGDWYRLEWTVPDTQTTWLCKTTGYADEVAALAASPADAADGVTGCGGGSWTTLTRPEDSTAAAGEIEGEWLEIWHADKRPIRFVPPASTQKVEVMAVISGHGFGDNGPNCAEFCDHQHQFTLNGGGSYTKTHPEAGTATGCVTQVADGTVPNQSGTWVYGRGGWCPGMEVDLWTADVTADVVMGAENEISYLGLLKGSIWRPGGGSSARIDMVSYLVYYE